MITIGYSNNYLDYLYEDNLYEDNEDKSDKSIFVPIKKYLSIIKRILNEHIHTDLSNRIISFLDMDNDGIYRNREIIFTYEYIDVIEELLNDYVYKDLYNCIISFLNKYDTIKAVVFEDREEIIIVDKEHKNYN